jgi:hypothetical protein
VRTRSTLRVLPLEHFDPGVGCASQFLTPERQAPDEDAHATRGLGFGQRLTVYRGEAVMFSNNYGVFTIP